MATVPRLFQIKLRVPPVAHIWGPVLNAIHDFGSCKIADARFQTPQFWKCVKGYGGGRGVVLSVRAGWSAGSFLMMRRSSEIICNHLRHDLQSPRNFASRSEIRILLGAIQLR